MRALHTSVLLCALFIMTLGACAWGEGAPSGGDDDPGQMPAPVCGDGVCAGPEIGRCPADCGNPPVAMCGNGACDAGESNATCPADCPSQAMCGNGVCDAGETTGNCPGDCPAQGNCPADPFDCLLCGSFGVLCPSGHNQGTCTTCILTGGGATCSGGFPDGTCDAGENPQNCPFDCM